MKKTALSIAVAIIAASLVHAMPAQAQSNRTFVSGQGTDSGGCAITAPCRSFSYAITVTNAGGEIVVLSSAGYGSVTINKAIRITNEEGVEAAVPVSSMTDAITIAAGTHDVVNLRGLTLIGAGVGVNGITFTSGGTLNVQNTVITGFTNNALNLTPSGSSLFNISDTIVANNDNFGATIFPTGSNATVQGFFERVQMLGNSGGVLVDGEGAAASTTIQVTAADCAASGNAGTGFTVNGLASSAQPTFMVVNGKAVNNNQFGLHASNETRLIAETTTNGNSVNGYAIGTGGVIKTFGNNYIAEATNSGTLTTIAPK
jgi:hypothetical protein